MTERRGGGIVVCIWWELWREGWREEGGPLLYAFGESYGERVGWRRGGRRC